ncbi:multicopper oxidase domain-containing protein [Avibacterium avium]|uniref:multicopper oxidase domain-containing protein n=1 Tax=Avibacterium avium TaxID=751 RepID=UPI003BF8CFFC
MNNFSRRQFFKTTLTAGAFSAIPSTLWAADRQALTIPPLMETRRGKPVFLEMNSTQTQLERGKSSEVWGFNGNYLGPTLKMRQGDFAKLNYRNSLSQVVSLAIQGLQVNAESLGGISHPFKQGQGWSPILPITQPACTCWYSACTLGHSAYQTYRGLLGLCIIEDDESRKSSLPQKYGINDIPLILQDMQLNDEGVQLFQQNRPHFFGNRLFVNGQQAPYLDVPRGLVRLRLLNASLSRRYELRFDDERNFQLIALDQGFLPQAQPRNVLFLAPSERAEILVNLNEGGNATLIVGKKRNFFSKLTGFFASDEELLDNTVLELRPQGLSRAFNQSNAVQFNTDVVQSLKVEIHRERQFHLDTNNGMINQQRFDPRRIDVNPVLNSTERWIITSNEPTGFKIQGAKFILESINDKPVEESQLAWKDSLWIDGKMQILVRFEQPSSNGHPFLFGAADLMAADKGCIGLIVVQ